MTVPFVDLRAQYRSIKGEIDEAISRVVESAAFVLGPEVEAFEAEFAAYCGARYCVGVNSGTAALQLALQACGVGAGDEVIVPANTFFATAEAVSTAGATPVFVDADPVSYNIDPAKIEAAVTARTRAVIPVHLYGQPADLDAVFEVAARHNLSVVEDAAQAHGAEYKGRRVGALGRAGCFSFYPGKNLGAYGEGGAILTDDPEVARLARLLRDHGSERKYRHEIVGYNFRLEGIQGAILRVKLRHLDRWNELRRAHAARYDELLGAHAGSGLALPREMPYARHVYHLYVVQSDERDELQSRRRGRPDRHTLPRPRPPATRLLRARAQARRLPRVGATGAPRPLAPNVPRADRRADRSRGRNDLVLRRWSVVRRPWLTMPSAESGPRHAARPSVTGGG
jgi:dTDP-4-amino-4,6-dideoxygalactose transaminase